MEQLILPPKVRGDVCAFLQVGCDFIELNNKNACGPIGVYLLWWGQDTTQQVCLSPPILPPNASDFDSNGEHSYKGIRSTLYHIVSDEDQFENYLSDSQHLFLQVRDVDDNAIGFSAVERLSRLIKFGGIRDDVPVYSCAEADNDNENPKEMGKIRIWMTYDIRNGNESILPDNSSNGIANINMNSTDKINTVNPIQSERNMASNEPFAFRLPKNVARSNRSAPVLLVSKKKTPLRNSNVSSKNYTRKSKPTLTEQREKTIITQGNENIYSRTAHRNLIDESNFTKKNVTFLDQHNAVNPEVNECEIETVDDTPVELSIHDEYRHGDTLEVGLIDKYGSNFNDLQNLITRSNQRLAENDYASTKDWREREHLLIEKANVKYFDETKDETSSKDVKLQEASQQGSPQDHLGSKNFPKNKENRVIDKKNLVNRDVNIEHPGKESLSIKRSFPLPSWNLSTERLKSIAQISQFVVSINNAIFKPEIYPRLTQIWTRTSCLKTRDPPKYTSKSICTLQSNVTNTNLSTPKRLPKRTIHSKPTSSPTFFVTYSVPPERQDTNLCSKRGASIEKKKTNEASNELIFNGTSRHPIRFNNQILDAWWISNIDFKVHCRSMNQRVPTFIGYATLKLKHLLMNEKYTCDNTNNDSSGRSNAGMRLPIFASTSLKQEMKSANADAWIDNQTNTEIIGEMFLSFAFVKEPEKNTDKNNTPLTEDASASLRMHLASTNNQFQPAEKEQTEQYSSSKRYLDTLQTNSQYSDEDILAHAANEHTNNDYITPSTKTLDDDGNQRTILSSSIEPNLQLRGSGESHLCETRGSNWNGNSHILNSKESKSPSAEPLICYLRVPEGNNFSVPFKKYGLSNIPNGQTQIQPSEDSENIYVACRIFSSGTLIKSRMCEYGSGITSAQFNLQHCMSFYPEPEFLKDVCKENYLILESWLTTKGKKELIGISSISLHKMYTSFHDGYQLNATRTLELPVMISNGWTPVNNLLDGRYVGHLRVLFAVGFTTQIENLCRILSLPLPSKIERLNNTSEQHSGVDNVNATSNCSDMAPKTGHFCNLRRETRDNLAHTDLPVTNLIKDTLNSKNEVQEHMPNSSEILTLNPKFASLRLFVTVEEGRNLPIITGTRFTQTDHSSSSRSSLSLLPNTYVSLPRAYNDNFLVDGDPVKAMHVVSKLIPNSSNPRWEMQTVINCPAELLTDSRRQLIIKVWHRPHAENRTEDEPHQNEFACGIDDYVLGFAAIDLSPLLRDGYTVYPCKNGNRQTASKNVNATGLCGWYNLMDFVGRRKGQIKINVQPDTESQETRNELARLKATTRCLMDIQSLDNNSLGSKHLEKIFRSCEDASRDHIDGQNSLHAQPSVYQLKEIKLTSCKPSDTGITGSKQENISNNELEEHQFHNTFQVLNRASNTSSTNHWKLPQLPAENEEATRSILAAKLSDLDQLAQQLKSKLLQNNDKDDPESDILECRNSISLSNSDEEAENTTIVSSAHLQSQEKQTLSQLRVTITNQLSLMQENLLQSRIQDNTGDTTVVGTQTEDENKRAPLTKSNSESPRQSLDIIPESDECSTYSRDSPTSSISIEESRESLLIENLDANLNLHETKPSRTDNANFRITESNYEEVSIEEEMRSRMEPDGARNPSPAKFSGPKS